MHLPTAAGRVHGAVITGIDTEKQYVSVEWFENGETKGKEVGALYLECSPPYPCQLYYTEMSFMNCRQLCLDLYPFH